MTNIEENELTLSQLFTILKKSALKILIYALSAIIIVTAALVTFRSFTGKRSYSVTLTLTEADASTTKVLSDRANGALTSVLNSKYGSSATEYIAALSPKFSVTPYTPYTISDSTAATYVPTQFILTLEENSDLKLSDAAYKSILNAIADVYKTNCVPNTTTDMFSSSISYDYDIDTYLSYFDISEIADDLLSKAQSINNSLTASLDGVTELAKTYKCATKDSDGNAITKSATELLSDITNIISRIKRIRNNISDKQLGSLEYIKQELKRAELQVSAWQSLCDSADAALEQYATNKLGSGNVSLDENGNLILGSGDETYYKMYNDVQSKHRSLASAIQYRDELKVRKEALESPSSSILTSEETIALTATIKGELKTCHNLMKLLTDQYADVAAAYNNYKFGENYVTATVATRTLESLVSLTVIVIIDLAVFVIAVIVACCQTNSAMKSRNAVSAKADNQPNV